MTTEGDTRALERAVPRARDAEPDRVRGHLPAARGAARPLPAADRDRLPGARARARRCSQRRLDRGEDEVELDAGRRRRRRCSRCSRRSSTCTSPEPIGCYIVDLVAATRDAAQRPGRREPARQRSRSSSSSRARAALDGRDFVVPDDVKAVAVPGARAPADAAPRALGAARARRGRRRGARSRRCRRRRPRTARAARDDALGSPRARRLRGARRRSACSPRSSLGRPELVALAAPFALVLRSSALRARARPELRVDARRSTASARSRATSVHGRRSSSTPRAGATALELAARRCRPAWRRGRRQPARSRSRRRAADARRCRSRCERWGAFAVGDAASCARATGSASLAGRRGSAPALPLARLPERRDAAARCCAPLETQVVRRQPGRAHEGRRHRVRRPARRSRPATASRRINWRASARRGELLGERAASGAEHGRRPLPRHVRRGAARRPRARSTSTVRAATSLAHRYLERQGPRRRSSASAATSRGCCRRRARPALPHRRLAARRWRSC